MPSTVGEKFETIDFLSVAVINTMKIVQLYKKIYQMDDYFVAFVPC